MKKAFGEESFVVKASVMIDGLIHEIVCHRDQQIEQLDLSHDDPQLIRLRRQVLRDSCDDIIEGLRSLRSAILQHEVSQEDFGKLTDWFKAISEIVFRLVG